MEVILTSTCSYVLHPFMNVVYSSSTVLLAATGCACQFVWEVYNEFEQSNTAQKIFVAISVFGFGLLAAVLTYIRERRR